MKSMRKISTSSSSFCETQFFFAIILVFFTSPFQCIPVDFGWCLSSVCPRTPAMKCRNFWIKFVFFRFCCSMLSMMLSWFELISVRCLLLVVCQKSEEIGRSYLPQIRRLVHHYPCVNHAGEDWSVEELEIKFKKEVGKGHIGMIRRGSQSLLFTCVTRLGKWISTSSREVRIVFQWSFTLSSFDYEREAPFLLVACRLRHKIRQHISKSESQSK